jgi:hypothetical protein
MNTTDKQFTMADLFAGLHQWSNWSNYILNHFYSIHLQCNNEIRMQGNFSDELFDYLLLQGFIFTHQSMLGDSLSSKFEKDILINTNIVKFVIVLIQNSK